MRLFFLGLLCSSVVFAQGICGYYLMEKDDSGNQTVVEVFQKDQKYYAYGFANTDGSVSYDTKNPDESLRNRSLSGVVFMWDLKKDGDGYDGGKIYNNQTGKTYGASAKLEGDTLRVKATIWGFGKTLVWTRMSEEQVAPFLEKKPNMQEVLKTIP